MLYIDPDRIEKVFIHLLDNALRFTPNGGSVSISAAAVAGSVVVRFSDTGVGIPAKEIPMLFDKMRITMPGSKRTGTKTGLGLPICRGIVEAHGGTISAESKEGKGTNIYHFISASKLLITRSSQDPVNRFINSTNFSNSTGFVA